MKWKLSKILSSLANGLITIKSSKLSELYGLLCPAPRRTHLQPDSLLEVEGLCGLEVDQQAVLSEGLDDANVLRQAEVVANVLQAADPPGDWQGSHIL